MNQVVDPVENQVVIEKEVRHFIEDDVFQKLSAVRESVYQATDVSISIRNLVNILLKQANFEVLCDERIQRYG